MPTDTAVVTGAVDTGVGDIGAVADTGVTEAVGTIMVDGRGGGFYYGGPAFYYGYPS